MRRFEVVSSQTDEDIALARLRPALAASARRYAANLLRILAGAGAAEHLQPQMGTFLSNYVDYYDAGGGALLARDLREFFSSEAADREHRPWIDTESWPADARKHREDLRQVIVQALRLEAALLVGDASLVSKAQTDLRSAARRWIDGRST